MNVNESKICSFPVGEGRNANVGPRSGYNSARLWLCCSLIIFHSTECGATSVVALALTGPGGGVEEVRQSVSLPVSVSGQPSLQSD